MKNKFRFPIFILALFVVCLSSCTASGRGIDLSTSTPAPGASEPTDVWSSLLEVTPVPYASPLPAPVGSPLDGTYVNYDPALPQWWSCLRCADYRPAGGLWRMQFDRGVMRIYYEVTGWNSLASYQVSGDHLYLYNDPYCKEATGEYKWKLTDGNLVLETVDDPCSFQLRGWNLSGGAWAACPEGGALEGDEPRGCRDPIPAAVTAPVLAEGLTVSVHEADVRLLDKSPDVFVYASGADLTLPDGVGIAYSDESILYGNNRVLWTDEDWVEVSTDAPFSSIGVQFRGDYVIGWARVLFDGEEVWRGDTSRIWSELKVHGGYIEIAGFEPGEHTIRVERLEVDSRPVVVAFFGFNR